MPYHHHPHHHHYCHPYVYLAGHEGALSPETRQSGKISVINWRNTLENPADYPCGPWKIVVVKELR
ncbi:hypothetical protein E2C01_091054 [Portunus trituberculatus]|uniref:Uncharacterized protein n=1 Tax=Portunus trituberculatus TaxID=210409 RepID=A0A5B7JND2_PORTR|nr:hypothetical protein [Portunus trituberculatus]